MGPGSAHLAVDVKLIDSRPASRLLIGAAAPATSWPAPSRQTAGAGAAAPRRRAVGDRAVHLAGLQFLPAGRCLHLGKLAKRPDIVALSFHVDYWDYIGWKDPFASRETTERQRAYARVLKQRYVYTPEMVVDGIGHDTGRERGPIEALLAKAQRRSPRRATPELSRAAGGPLTIKLAAFALDGGPADVTLAIYDRRHTTPVAQRREPGPHAGELQHRAPARDGGRWDGSAGSWTMPPTASSRARAWRCWCSSADHGPMIGCNKLEPAYSG